MCQKCVRRLKNLGPPRTVKPGLIRVLAIQLRQGRGIPLFWELTANLAVEAQAYQNERAKTRRHYTRKGRRHDTVC